MDLQSALVVGGVTVATLAVLVLISLFKSSGTSYEEAIAEQRRATNELLALAGTGNKQAVKKNKKAGKKAKEKKQKEAATGSERDSDVPADSGVDEESVPVQARVQPQRAHVEFGESTVLDPTLEKPVKNQSEKKEEVVEKKEVKEVKQVKTGKGKGKQATVAPPAEPVEDVTPKDVSPKDVLNSGDFSKEQRKTKKNEKRSVVDDAGDKPVREEAAPTSLHAVQPSELATDKLPKNIAQPAASPVPTPPPAPPAKQKKKKSEQNVMSLVGNEVGAVNVSELVRLVSDAVLSRNEIQILTDTLLNKQHGVLPVHSDWTEGPNDPVQKLKKQLAEKEKALLDEQEAANAVRAKLKELRASLDGERGRASAATRAAEEALSAHKVEVHTLSTRLQRLLDDNHTLTQQKHFADNELAAQRAQLEMHLQRQGETEAELMSQLHALQTEMATRMMELSQARCEAAAARDHCAELAQQLQAANQMLDELEMCRSTHALAEQHASAELRVASERAAELTAEVGRLSRTEQALSEAEAANRQLKAEVKSLQEQLAAKEEELKKEIASHQQNGLPPPEDPQKKIEMKKLESVVESLQKELASVFASHAEEKRQLATLQEQLQQYKDKNNEAIEKALEQHYQSTAAALRSACPQAAPPGPGDERWVVEFAEQLTAVLRAAGEGEAGLREAREQNAQLQELVDKYKKIIEDTEGVLSELQQNVMREEESWRRQLGDKQRELDRLRQTTITQMQSKIDSLQAELDRSRAPHTMADMERGMEETNRLLSLSGKHQLESLNGPSQVGLEEK